MATLTWDTAPQYLPCLIAKEGCTTSTHTILKRIAAGCTALSCACHSIMSPALALLCHGRRIHIHLSLHMICGLLLTHALDVSLECRGHASLQLVVRDTNLCTARDMCSFLAALNRQGRTGSLPTCLEVVCSPQ